VRMSWPNPSMTRWLCGSRRTTTGDLRRIDVQPIVKCGLGFRGLGFSWVWKNSEGERTASVGARVEGDENEAYLHLDYRVDGAPMKQCIKLVASPCRFGGVRWLARCPSKGRSVAHLYIGSSGAYSRHAYGLKFDSQRECALDRSLRRREKALAKLKAKDPEFFRRPKGMHRRTFEQLSEAVFRENENFDRLAVARFGGAYSSL